MRYLPLFAVLLAACGGSSSPVRPTPSPSPAPSSINVTGTLTDTTSGATIGTFTRSGAGFPLQVSVEAPGYVSRTLYVQSTTPTVDLIPDRAPFSLGFFRIFARNAFDEPGTTRALLTQPGDVRIYLRTILPDGSPASPNAISIVAQQLNEPGLIESFSGGRLHLAAFDQGIEPDRAGWVIVGWDRFRDACGRANVGGRSITFYLNRDETCGCRTGNDITAHTVRHEVGHMMGFFHTGDSSDLMSGLTWSCTAQRDQRPSDRERYHATLAYKRLRGNLDIDRDPVAASSVSALRARETSGPVIAD